MITPVPHTDLPPSVIRDLGGDALPVRLYAWLAGHLPEGRRILELGSGTGTRALCRLWGVLSVEHDPAWAGFAQRETTARVITAPLVGGWYDPDVLESALQDEAYDLLLIDGPPSPPSRPSRHLMLGHVHLFDLSVPIAIDDVHRWAERRLFTRLARHTGRRGEIMDADDKQFGVIL